MSTQVEAAKAAIKAVATAIKNTLVSTQFRHMVVVTVVPLAVYVVNQVQEQATSEGLSGLGLVVVATICTAVVNKLRRMAS